MLWWDEITYLVITKDNNNVKARNVVESEFENLVAIPSEMDATQALFAAKYGNTTLG